MRRRFEIALNRSRPAFTTGDALVVLLLTALLYLGVRLAVNAPAEITGPTLSLAPSALPWYAFLSVGRILLAYLLSLIFTLVYGYAAARHRTAEKILMPLLDVLQSVPILSFLPIVLLSLSAILPEDFAIELASIVLIFTSQAWNMTYSFYQSLTTIPTELREASAIFRLNSWLRFKTMELPSAAIGLIWNSIMSWAGGWFFLMASEVFVVRGRDFRLTGLGSYLQAAANAGDVPAILAGLVALVLVIVLLDQFIWRPLLAWADKFKLQMVSGDEPPESWFYDALSSSWLIERLGRRVWHPLAERIDLRLSRAPKVNVPTQAPANARPSAWVLLLAGALIVGVVFAIVEAAGLLITLSVDDWTRIGLSLGATLLRVAVSLLIALSWTIPVGVLIGTRRRAATVLQPIVQIAASIPATALFPIFVVVLIKVSGGLDVAAVLLMLLGTQWYVLFNVIAGAAAIPQDLEYTTRLLQVRGWQRWRTLILPALFPYLITGMITASGGAWNASVIAEHVHFNNQTYDTTGIGAMIAEATASGHYALLLASTLALIVTVVAINRLFWRRLVVMAEERYRLE